ncbi:MAG: hypothetical protein ACI9WC_000151 [Arenicella sp.]|jgi:hypothetical protein
MKKRFQDISFRVSKYFRPFEPWHCGGLQNGETCLLGPDKNGRCRAITDCEPDKKDNTWHCTRSELMGGKCQTGPQAHGECGRQRPPCTPAQNIRTRHLRLGLVAFILMLGFTFSGVAFNFWSTATSAGPLSRHHASFGEASCQSCHETAKHSRLSWLVNFTRPHAQQDTNNCLSCHKLGVEAALAHSLAPSTIDILSQKISQASIKTELSDSGPEKMVEGTQVVVGSGASMWVRASKALFGSPPEELPCSTCHQEHIGSSAQITQVSNQQCAVCHTDSFDSLADHTRFTNYPAERRTSIVFGHNSHLFKHFKDEKFSETAPQGCQSCHALDLIGRKMEVSSFEQSCASCHQDQITGENRASGKGIAMLSVPTLDLETLRARGVDVGEWPANSNADLTPLSLILIAAYDKKLAKQLPLIQQMDLYDLTDASDQDLDLVYQVAWRLKQIFFEIQRGGAVTLIERLGLLGSALTDGSSLTQPQNLLGLLSPDVVDAMVGKAFPSLQSEVAQWILLGSPAFTIKPLKTIAVPTAVVPAAVEATADDDWLAVVASDGGDADDWLDESSTTADEGEAFSLDDDEGDEFSIDDDSGFDDENAFAEDSSASLSQDSSVKALTMNNSRGLSEAVSLEDRVAAGGWFVEGYYLYYRPAGHADQLIVAWLDYIVSKLDSASELGKPMLSSFTNKDNPGSCFKCHSVETDSNSESGSALKVNWLGAETPPNVQDFNRFKHRAHFAVVEQSGKNISLLGDGGCISCHKSNDSEGSSDSYEQMDASVFESEFADLDKATCVNCHQADTGLAACTLCHNYHIGESGLIQLSDSFSRDGLAPASHDVE